MSESKIRPCPFCGSEWVICSRVNEPPEEYQYKMICDFTMGGCGASGGYRNSSKEAVEAWNRRAEGEENECAD